MHSRRLKRIGRVGVFAVAFLATASILASLDLTKTTVDAASLKHIDEIVAQGGTFNILEIVPDTAAASVGYYIDGQEPSASWTTAVGALTSPSARSTYVNNLFSRLATKGVLGSVTSSPLKYTYYDSANRSYYTEAYTVTDPQNWTKIHLNAVENGTVTGTMSPQAKGPYLANFLYIPQASGGYVQNIKNFLYTASPVYGQGTYYYSPTFTQINLGDNLDAVMNCAVYMKDAATGIYSTAMTVQDKLNLGGFSANDPTTYYYVDPAQPGTYTRITPGMDLSGKLGFNVYTKDAATGAYNTSITIREKINAGGFDTTKTYYYVNPTQTGAPGNNKYAAVVSTSDNDDAPGDCYTTPPQGASSYFTRTIDSYIYVGTGGNYTFAATGGTSYRINYTDIYCKAGYVNNNLFKTLVFGLDSTNMNALGVTVTVKKASDVASSDISGANLIYISSGTDITKSGVTVTYSASNDIPDGRGVDLYNYAAGKNPIIIDYSIIQGITQSTSASSINRIQKTCLLNLQSSISATTQTSLSGLTVNWTNLSYMTSDVDKTFVNNNIYCFNAFNNQTLGGAANITSLVSSLFNDSFSQNVYSSGFTAVLTEIQNENFLRTIAGQQNLMPQNVTVSASVRQIINYNGRRQSNQKTAITVLDLEPAKATSSTWLTAETVRSWINNALPAAQIKIVHMTTGEFNGKIEDLNETYDMIYIGMSTETMNVSGGSTVYNDTSMNGLVYSNIGDKYYATMEMAGIRNQDYLTVGGTKAINGTNGTNANLFRFSGNDITRTAVTAFQNYVQAGYPIILADGFVSGSAVNTARVDSSSYMYEALSHIYGPNPNVMTQTNAAANDSTVIQYMNVSKPVLNLTAQPVSYTANSNATLTRDPDSHYYLSYTLSIGNVTDTTPISTTYDCRLFIDLNADGRFADGEEFGDIVVNRVSDGGLILPLKDNNDGEYYALSADVQYKVSRQMPDDYVGIIPWNLKVSKNGANQVHASASGFTRIAAGNNSKTIKVLQIMQAGTSASKLNLKDQLTVDPAGSNAQLRGVDGKYYKGIYGKLIADLQDFDVTIDMIENDDLEAMGNSLTIQNYLNAYHMLIIGFNDCYDGTGSKSAAAIVSYIGSGKSVLFTHDTTSLSQVPAGNFPMAINGSAPKVRTLDQTDVLYNSATQEYKSINGKINWKADYSTAAPPPYIRQASSSTYVVLMNSNISSTDETAYWGARAGSSQNYQVYQMSDGNQLTTSITNSTTLANFRSAHPNATIIYVFCTSASGWYGTGWYDDTCDIITTNNFTKFTGGTKYTCTGMTYEYDQGSKNNWNFASMTSTKYEQIMRCLYNENNNGYDVIGTYNQSSNTYSISGATYYPATGASFPQATLYDKDPASPYTLGTIPNGITDWGYYFNTVIRDAVGLDRYGVTSSLPLNGGATLGSLVNVTAPMTFDNMTTVLQHNRSVAYMPKSGRSSTVNEYQGYTNYALIRFAGSGNTYDYTDNKYNNRETTMVSQVNKGQITTYPYNVNTAGFGGADTNILKYGGSYMQIGNTHEQYFQINMNTDDIVVWYCLSNVTFNGTASTVDDASYYDDVPNDCVNAYYIYNKGNVTYSGVGHTSDAGYYKGSNIGQQYINEAKLFVNTMIAAYRSGDQEPSVRIMSDARGVTELSQKYVAYDEQYNPKIMNDQHKPFDAKYSPVLEESLDPTDENRAVYFRVYEPNVGGDRAVTATYFVSTDGGTTLIPLAKDGTIIKTYDAGGSAAQNVVNASELKGGFVYHFFLPNDNCLDYLRNPDLYSIRIYIKVDLNGSNLSGSDFLNINKQQLFQLR